jgi:hypothetical protein
LGLDELEAFEAGIAGVVDAMSTGEGNRLFLRITQRSLGFPRRAQ